MLTPLDIHNKVFTKGMRGYRMEEVDAFLDEVIRNYESLFRENHDLKERVKRMEDEVSRSKELGASLQKTMLMAQKLVDDETIRAKKEGELIQWEAQKKAEQIIAEAQNEVLVIKQEIERLKLYEKQLYLKHKGFLEFQMELLDGYKENAALPNVASGDAKANGEAELDSGMPASEQSDQQDSALPAADKEESDKLADSVNGADAAESAAGADTAEGASDDNEADSVEQVFLMAQKMEEALKSLDSIYGSTEASE